MAESWKPVSLGDVATVALSGVDKHIIPGEITVRLCNYLDVYRNRRLTREMDFLHGSATPGEIARFTLLKGDVVITKDSETPNDIGVPAVVVDNLTDTICGYHLALIRPGRCLDSRFLLHYLQADVAKQHFLRTANGVTRFGLGMRAVSSLPVLLPCREEQAAIARVLDAVDTALGRTRAAVERAQQLRRSLLADLLSLGIGPGGHVRDQRRDPSAFARTPSGVLPASWALSTVGREFSLQNGFTLNEGRQARFRKHPYLRVANVQRDDLHLTDVQELEASDAELKPRRLAEDDLLVVEGHADRMQIGRCARVTAGAVGMTFQNHLFRLRSHGGVVPAFGCLWLNSSIAQRYWNARCATSSGLNTINQRSLKRLTMLVPPKPEQNDIVNLIALQRAHLEAMARKCDRLDALKKALVQDLLTGRVRVTHLAEATTS